MTDTQLPATVQTAVTNTETWLKVHERLIIVLMVVMFSYFVVYKGFSLASSWENHKAQQANATLSAQTAKNASDLTQAKQMLSDYQSALANATGANQTLSKAISARTVVVQKQQETDATLSPSDLSNRWSNILDIQGGVAPAINSYTVSPPAAVATVQKLEEDTSLQQNLKDEQSKEVNDQQALGKANDLIDQGKITVNGLQLALTDQQNSCTVSLNAVKADARKGKLKWFSIGFITGFIAGKIW